MSKFAKTLASSNKEIMASRAEMLGEEVALEVSTFVGGLKKEVLGLKNKINRLTDLSPSSKDSLRPGGESFDPSRWVKELHEATLDLTLKEVELSVAEKIQSEWFSDEE
jgi:hypothetical protein